MSALHSARYHKVNKPIRLRRLDAAIAAVLMMGTWTSALAQSASTSSPAVASSAATTATAAAICDAQQCTQNGQVVMRVRSLGDSKPVTGGTANSDAALAPDRRVTVTAPVDEPGKAVARARFNVDLPNGGLIWATEDPTLTTPVLNIQGSSTAAFSEGRIVEPVRFQIYSNYDTFIRRMKVSIYKSSDTDLVTPLAEIDVPPGAVASAVWDGKLPADARLHQGDELRYVLRAWGEDGSLDETYSRTLQLVRPVDRQRGLDQMHQSASTALRDLSSSQLEERQLLDSTFGSNALSQQNITIRGSRVRVFGQNVPEGYGVNISGQTVPIDQQRKFVAEYLMPSGLHTLDVSLQGPAGATMDYPLAVNVRDNYLFAVAIADVTASKGSVSGAGASALTVDPQYKDGFLDEGRLAFYMKGKLDGRYLLTAQADTTERSTGSLFDGFFKADPRDVFRRLDPNMYYPVYGDDSTTYRDIDTQGKLYARLDWDKSQALWGNYQTGFTGTRYAQYIRSLYGAAIDWRSRASTPLGDPNTLVKAFASQAQTVLGHTEFLGTGGSLYYLRHTDLLPGSDQLVLEVRDPTTGGVVTRVTLVRGADYQINEMQGRVLLTRPLAQISNENVNTLIRDRPLSGYENHLLADYEYVPSGFDSNDVAAGLRAKHWFGEHVAVGGTYVDEGRSGDDYTLKGADVTLQEGRGTYLKVERSHSNQAVAPIFYSDNGGLSFFRTNNNTQAASSGNATSVDARANFKELGWTAQEWTAGSWWRDVTSGYSVARADLGQAIHEYGAEFSGQLSHDLKLSGRYSKAEQGSDALEQGQLQLDWRLADHSDLIAELRRVTETYQMHSGTGTLAALGYTRRLGSSLDVYGNGQVTLADDGGAYPRNNSATAGAKYLFGDLSTVGAEVTGGDRGNAAQVNGEYRLSQDHSLYGAYTYSVDSTALYNNSTLLSQQPDGLTLGQRWRLSNQTNLYNESQWLKTGPDTGIGHTFGMDFYPAIGWTTGFTLQDGKLDAVGGGRVNRHAGSVSGGLTTPDTSWSSKLEYRRDEGAEQRKQWVTTHNFSYKFSESLRVAARINGSTTKDDVDPANNARFVESNIGFAWRPWDSTRWTLLGKYTYLYDLSSPGQVESDSLYDQRSTVYSLEGVYRLDTAWEFSAKLATRLGEARLGRGTGAWFDNRATLAGVQARRYVFGGLSVMGEYRVLSSNDSGTRHGWLTSVDYDIGKHFRMGIGYNMTDFSDDMTKLGYRYHGWFLNAVGYY